MCIQTDQKGSQKGSSAHWMHTQSQRSWQGSASFHQSELAASNLSCCQVFAFAPVCLKLVIEACAAPFREMRERGWARCDLDVKHWATSDIDVVCSVHALMSAPTDSSHHVFGQASSFLFGCLINQLCSVNHQEKRRSSCRSNDCCRPHALMISLSDIPSVVTMAYLSWIFLSALMHAGPYSLNVSASKVGACMWTEVGGMQLVPGGWGQTICWKLLRQSQSNACQIQRSSWWGPASLGRSSTRLKMTSVILTPQQQGAWVDVSRERSCLQRNPEQLMATKDKKTKIWVSIPRRLGSFSGGGAKIQTL